jgi:hydrogenase nickel incorporation protein HypA/HybF
MHEMGITLEVMDVVARRAAGARVRRVVLEIGKLCAVLPEAVRFCFECCREGTDLAEAELEIVETPGRARCRGCGGGLELERPYGLCPCGSSDLEWLSGEELRIKEIEVE